MNLNHLLDKLKNARHNQLAYYEKGKKVVRSFAEVYQDVVRVAAYLQSAGYRRGSRIGILGKNSYHWVVLDLACVVSGYITVPFDPAQPHDPAELVSTCELALLVTGLKEHAPVPGQVCSFGQLMTDAFEGGNGDDGCFPGPEAVAYGDDDPFTVIFTSGTSGKSKAIEVRKASFDHLLSTSQDLFGFRTDDRFMVFLPLHIYLERCYIYGAILLGFSVILTPLEAVFASLRRDKPTVIIAIPYFFENVYTGFMQKIRANVFYQLIFKLYLGLRSIGLGFLFNHRFGPFARLWGGQIRYLLTGAAPMRREVLDFYARMGMPLYEGYGMSEVGGMIALNHPASARAGSVGKPFPGKRITLDQEGQILVQSPYHANTRYYRAGPGENEKTYLPGNTVATGDLGYFDEEGFLYITGRSKELIVLSTGVKVHPVPIEKKLMQSDLFANCLVSGDNRPYLTALVVPKEEHTGRERVQAELDRINAGLPAPEKVYGFFLSPEKFSVSNGMLTSSLKVNRRKAMEKFLPEFEQLY